MPGIDELFRPASERRVQLQIDTTSATKRAVKKLALDNDVSIRHVVLYALMQTYPSLSRELKAELSNVDAPEIVDEM